MRVTEIQMELVPEPAIPVKIQLLAYIQVVLTGELGDLAIHDLKLLRGQDGELFVSMPSKRIKVACQQPGCGGKNIVGASYCNACGRALPRLPAAGPPAKIYADIIHPINRPTRDRLEEIVLAAYRAKLEDSDATAVARLSAS